MINIEELEWYSHCCNALPLRDLHYEEEYDAEPVGSCSQCKEGAIFYLGEDNETEHTNSNNNRHICNSWSIIL